MLKQIVNHMRSLLPTSRANVMITEKLVHATVPSEFRHHHGHKEYDSWAMYAWQMTWGNPEAKINPVAMDLNKTIYDITEADRIIFADWPPYANVVLIHKSGYGQAFWSSRRAEFMRRLESQRKAFDHA